MASYGGPVVAPVDDDIVALGLARDRFADSCDERLVALGLTQRLPQIGRVLLPQAHIERPGSGLAHAVAALAEIMGEWRDEAEPSSGLAHRYVARRTAAAVIGFVECPPP